jgi:hypothetical protein
MAMPRLLRILLTERGSLLLAHNEGESSREFPERMTSVYDYV